MSSAELREARDASGARVLALSGRLDAQSTGSLWRRAMALAAASGGGSLVVDASGLEYCDGSGAALLVALRERLERAGGRFALRGLQPDLEALVRSLEPTRPGPVAAAPARRASPALVVGRASVAVWDDLRAQIAFVGELMIFLSGVVRRPRQLRLRDAVAVADRAGIGATPIVALVGFLLGLILAFQGAIPMGRFGAQIFVADLLGISMLRELGPLMAAILLTARSGSAFAAEIGTMKVNEEIDALTTMGLEPVRFLVVPRVVAALAVVPALTMLTSLSALLGGLVVFVSLGFPSVTYWSRIATSVKVTDVASGLVKGMVFGVIVAGIGCLRGLQTGTGAQAVGASTTSAVVSGIILIAITDGIFAVVFYVLGI